MTQRTAMWLCGDAAMRSYSARLDAPGAPKGLAQQDEQEQHSTEYGLNDPHLSPLLIRWRQISARIVLTPHYFSVTVPGASVRPVHLRARLPSPRALRPPRRRTRWWPRPRRSHPPAPAPWSSRAGCLPSGPRNQPPCRPFSWNRRSPWHAVP